MTSTPEGRTAFVCADARNPLSVLADALPAGSHLTISHATADFDPDSGSKAARAAASGGIDYHNRTLAEVERYFDGLVLEEPGVVPMLEWRPGIRHPRPRSVYYWVGMDRKPLRWPP
ncbi:MULTISPECIES: SAM-dependent methyltransferase [unclassified Pseudonocardia]|jgi:hypothetical protein|uniref:SAM-dependent methyltransferase n=1 Tax=unclassified Pseudonocardia TaxID=2619320 RepID=UPI000964BDF5|nr:MULTISPECIES: SAM-dependent methyltransferase [unclassified Pseudonocardia]MBN9097098.1 SAM-dependent methyltransferase [Pseudonocardia sp.]OJY42208.1 MAG: hypothetical protein BGP03_10075 [Pseudonocardia sp. 73-21]